MNKKKTNRGIRFQAIDISFLYFIFPVVNGTGMWHVYREIEF